MFFVADFLYLKAYNSGGTAMVITTCLVLMPVVATAVKSIWVWEAPSLYQICAFGCAAAAVVFIGVDESRKEKKGAEEGEPHTKTLQVESAP
jgi:drug/metabolite transporter (DMT)-like permease